MDRPADFDARRFLKGATLAERARAPHRDVEADGFDAAKADRRMKRWRSRAPLDRDEVFAERLAQEGLTQAELLRMLGESPEALGSRFEAPPEWLAELREAHGSEPVELPSGVELPPSMSYVTAVLPLFAKGLCRVQRAAAALAAAHAEVPMSPERAVAACAPYLFSQANNMMSRTVALELSAARLEGRLRGETPEERFASWVKDLKEPEQLWSFLADYPVLARQLVRWADTWADVCTELLARLWADHALIARTFGDGAPGDLARCEMGAGDPHRGGRTVSLLTFSSGLRVVYKPRPLSVDRNFQALLAWLGERGASPAPRTMEILDRGEYGWVELVAHGACSSREEVRRFYGRLGVYLALMHALGATDLHLENIIAAGEHPLIIDVESVFHPHFIEEGGDTSDEIAARIKEDSVLRVGLLPARGWATKGSEGIDYSGLGGGGMQLTARATPVWEGLGTDEMRLVKKRVLLPEAQNRPLLDGQPVDPVAYRHDLVDGFCRAYRLILERRAELLSAEGPLACFARDRGRAVMRPTHLYTLLYREAYHPDLLRDGLDRDGFFDKLWVPLDQVPYTRRLIPFEQKDLWNNDVPMFTCVLGERHLWTSTGEKLADFFPSSGLDLALRKLARLSEDDLAVQRWFIQASFTALTLSDPQATMPSYEVREGREPPERRRLVEAAYRLADRLCQLALSGREGDACWIGLSAVGQRYWEPMPLGVDLYGGLPGIALFLAYAASVLGEPRFAEMARSAMKAVVRRLDQDPSRLRSIGAFGDIGGSIYALSHLGSLWGDPRLLDEAERLVGVIASRVAEDENHDVMNGAAGAILALHCLDRVRPSKEARAVSLRCGERLLASARPMERGTGWVTPLGSVPLTGLSHGAAGVAWALGVLAREMGEAEFEQAARRAIEYERSQLSVEAGNWMDLRDVGAPGGFMMAYCHGAPGIALGRALLLPYLDDGEIRDEIRLAAATTLACGFGGSHCLCHGDLGNLECARFAARALGDSELEGKLGRLSAGILDDIEQRGPSSGVPTGVETPGLMNGLTGIGLGLLRLAAPSEVPSVLALEPPRPLRGALVDRA